MRRCLEDTEKTLSRRWEDVKIDTVELGNKEPKIVP